MAKDSDSGRTAGTPNRPLDLVVTDEARAAGTGMAGAGPQWAPPHNGPVPAPPPPARWPADAEPPMPTLGPPPVPQSMYYREIAPRPYDEGPARAGHQDPVPRKQARVSGWTIALVLMALVGGTAIGLAYRGAQSSPASTPVAEPTATEPFEISASVVSDEGSLVRLAWTDPTNGEAVFVISQTTPEVRLLRDTPRGDTEAVIDGLNPDVPRYCFRVLAILDAQTTASATACTPTPR